MPKWLKMLMGLGLRPEHSLMDTYKIRSVNLLSLVISGSSLACAAVFLATQNIFLGLVAIAAAPVFTLPMWLNAQGRIGWARGLYFLLQNNLIALFAILYGPDIGLNYPLLVTSFTPLVLFRQPRSVALGIAIFAATFLLVEIAHYQQWEIFRLQDAFLVSLIVKIAAMGVFLASMIAVMREFHRLEAQREGLLQKLRDNNAHLESFNYIVSHDLKSPLRNIGAFAELLEREWKKGPEAQSDRISEFLGIIKNSARNMMGMFDSMLAYARYGIQHEDAKHTDLNATLAEVLTNLRSDIESQGAHIEASTLPSIKAHPHHMQQLFQNLIGNALRYRKPQVPPHIRIGAQQAGKTWQISISDNGVGIHDNMQEDIFKPLLRADERGEGHGLGLAICDKIMRGMGGRISVQSQRGEGSTFTLHFPIGS